MNDHDIREFVERQREPVQALKRQHWRSSAGEGSALSALQAGYALYEHARLVQPNFPSERYLADDFAHHLQLKRLLDRAASAFAIRRTPR